MSFVCTALDPLSAGKCIALVAHAHEEVSPPRPMRLPVEQSASVARPAAGPRVSWVDNAKALGIFLVIYGHVLESGVRSGHAQIFRQYQFLYSFHLPLFFFMAGFFWKRRSESLEMEIVRLAKTRLLPVAFFSAILLPLWLLKFRVETGALHLYEIKARMLGYFSGHTALNYVMWFVVCLFVTEVLAYLLLPRLRSLPAKIVAALLVLLAGLFVCTRSSYFAGLLGVNGSTWYWQEAIVALGFYALGHALFPWLRDALAGAAAWKRGGVSLVALVAAAVAAGRNGIDGGFVVYMTNGVHGASSWFLAAAFAGIAGLLGIASLLPPARLLTVVGSATLGLLGFNGFFQDFVNPRIAPFLFGHGGEGIGTALAMLSAVISIMICLPIIAWLDRRVPGMLGNSPVRKTDEALTKHATQSS